MEKRGLVSVIVPIYKVENYIEECIESILAQTYRELEIILVDDGSPDRCGAICDRYAQMDPRILALHPKNGGAAAARNVGLRTATGAYITFVDSDDYLEPDAYAHMVRALEETGADVVQAGFRNVYVNGQQIHPGAAERCDYSTIAYLTHFTEDWTCALCWDKLFRKNVLTDVFFEEGHLIDDEFFTYKAIFNARKIVYIPTVTYNHRLRSSSVMRNPAGLERKNRDTLEAMDKRRRDVAERFPELKTHYENNYADYLLYYSTTDRATAATIREIKKRLLTHMACGKALPWKPGQRKLFLRILTFLAKPAGSILRKRKEGAKYGEYELFE